MTTNAKKAMESLEELEESLRSRTAMNASIGRTATGELKRLKSENMSAADISSELCDIDAHVIRTMAPLRAIDNLDYSVSADDRGLSRRDIIDLASIALDALKVISKDIENLHDRIESIGRSVI